MLRRRPLAVLVVAVLANLFISTSPTTAQLGDDLYFDLARFDAPYSGDTDSNDLPVIVQYWNGQIESSDTRTRLSTRTASYTLQPIGAAGVQVLVIPSATQLEDYVYGPQLDEPYMYVLGVPVRPDADDDRAMRGEGVEVDFVSFSENSCRGADNCWQAFLFDQEVYASVEILTETVSGATKSANLYGVGDSFWIESNLVSVNERVDDAFEVTVTPYNEIDWDSLDPWWEGRFRDDEGSVHEGAMDALAERGILIGRSDRTIRPGATVTRAEMAVTLTRALGAEPTPGENSRFSDVPPDSWFGPAINHLASINVVNGYPDGTFKPYAPVTRAQFASFIVRAFSQFSPVEEPAGIFADVAASATHAPTVEALYEAGVTKGCRAEPLRYCPSKLVKRDQTASFLARVLGLVS